MRKLEYVLVDVFTRNPLEGNQLAVFLDGRGLSPGHMQALARELNLAETTFVLPGEGTKGSHRVRIFTTAEELPFAGHPTLGTARVLLEQNPGVSEIVLQLNVGEIPVRFEQRDGMTFGEMLQRDPEFGQVHARETVARIAGLPLGSFGSEPIQTVSTGVGFAIVPLSSVEALRALRFEWHSASEYLSTTDAKLFYFIARDPQRDTGLEARMISSEGEDPATGSAAGCCIAWCLKHRVISADAQVVIHQGALAGRPSEIFVRAALNNELVSDVRVGGFTVVVGSGAFQIS